MATGQALTDADRGPWLRQVGLRLASAEGPLVIACSALKGSYRDIIRQAAPETVFIHLTGSIALLHARMSRREEHFMPVTLLQSQLESIEQLDAHEKERSSTSQRHRPPSLRGAARWLTERTESALSEMLE